MIAGTERFGDRVADYARYRPSYPETCIAWLADKARISVHSVVADIGSGTGIFSRLWLPLAGAVHAVEPNTGMRQAAESELGNHANFHSHAGDSCATGLAAGSIDLISVAQAFHWFEVAPTLAEFRRIARPDAQLALVWNKRPTDTPFLAAYEAALRRHCPEYALAKHRDLSDATLAVCFAGPMVSQDFANPQSHDLAAVLGGMQSASYCPQAGEPGHRDLVDEVSAAFHRHESGGHVDWPLLTQVYFGRI